MQTNSTSTVWIRLASLLFCLMPCFGFTQTLEITRLEQEGTRLNIYYDLIDTDSNRYTVKLFSSHDLYTTALKKVGGDAGLQISPGRDKRIVWNMADEYGSNFGANFEEQLSFEIRGALYKPFLKLNENYTKLKRGKSYPLTWVVSGSKRPLNIDLMLGEETIARSFAEPDQEKFKLKLPTSLKPGKSYRVRLSDSTNADMVVLTNEFGVTRRFPLALQAAPVVVIGAAILFLSRFEPESNRLPDPVKPQ